ncbi:unnamed protein product [Linum tenue]|uniref:Uncharacterized protein n=1 Tax=Linum tenue TaxID=586396 RepID=A0AAV0IJY0_9ROSI|nr:unnamed protein product [Linum tenue]
MLQGPSRVSPLRCTIAWAWPTPPITFQYFSRSASFSGWPFNSANYPTPYNAFLNHLQTPAAIERGEPNPSDPIRDSPFAAAFNCISTLLLRSEFFPTTMATKSSLLLVFLLLGSLSLSATTAAQTPNPSPPADSDPNSPSPTPSPESGSPSPVSNSPHLSPPAPPTSDLHSPASGPAPSPTPADENSPAPSPSEAVDGNKSGSAMATEDGEIANSSGMSGGKKAGIAVGLVAAVCVVGIGGMVYRKRQQNLRRAQFGSAARADLL